jgi:ABC-type lipoprotein export system ATPase subunit/ABC-type antimicrobial peptide transport system permease subunit
MELIRLVDITKTYHLGEIDVPVLKGISLSIHRGEMVALMGASGSGKTTLMNLLGCLDRPSSGEFWLDGKEMSQLTPNQRALVRTDKLGFVFQSFNLLPRTNAVHQVLMPLDYSPKRHGAGESQRLAHVLLDRVGLTDRMDHEPSQMSGGQQQRVAIARSLVNRPALLLADEPTGNLDSHTSVEILRMFQQLNAEGITVILVTHDPKVATFASRIIRLADGLVEGDETRTPDVAVNPWAAGAAIDSGNGQSNGDSHGSDSHGSDSHGSDSHGNGDGSGSSLETPAGMTALAAGRTAVATTPAAAEKRQAAKSLYGDVDTRPPSFGISTIIPPTWRTALGALRRNKMRSALTALGVIFGVWAVIAMSEIGEGSKAAVQKQIASMGANNLVILPGAAMSGGVSFGAGSRQTLTPEDGSELVRQSSSAISDYAPLVQQSAQLVYGHTNWRTQSVVGTTPNYLNVRDWNELLEGEVFSDRDVLNANKVCMVGTTIKRELFDNESPVGKDLRISNVAFHIIGVLSSKGANMMGRDQDDIVVAPWTTVKYRLSSVSSNAVATANPTESQSPTSSINSLSATYPNSTALYASITDVEQNDTPQSVRLVTVDNLLIKASSDTQIPQAIREIKSLLRERHHIKNAGDADDTHDDFNIRDMTELTRTMSQTSTTIGYLLLIVAAISLVVGGVGIMNIMLVSVTERTKEIGLRMAVGARSHHILRQFLVEAVVLCLVGGAIGIVLGRVTSILVRYYAHWATQPSIVVITVAVAVSAAVGIVFGFYPAWKASRLDPIEALRYE